jgi:hypothetical protein
MVADINVVKAAVGNQGLTMTPDAHFVKAGTQMLAGGPASDTKAVD